MGSFTEEVTNGLKAAGAATLVPLILASGPLAGYVLGRFLLVEKLGAPKFTIPVFVVLGIFAAALQITRLIQRIKQSDRS